MSRRLRGETTPTCSHPLPRRWSPNTWYWYAKRLKSQQFKKTRRRSSQSGSFALLTPSCTSNPSRASRAPPRAPPRASRRSPPEPTRRALPDLPLTQRPPPPIAHPRRLIQRLPEHRAAEVRQTKVLRHCSAGADSRPRERRPRRPPTSPPPPSPPPPPPPSSSRPVRAAVFLRASSRSSSRRRASPPSPPPPSPRSAPARHRCCTSSTGPTPRPPIARRPNVGGCAFASLFRSSGMNPSFRIPASDIVAPIVARRRPGHATIKAGRSRRKTSVRVAT